MENLKGLFQGLIPDANMIVRAFVMSANPLKLQVLNDPKLILGEHSLIIPQHLTDYEIDIDISSGESENEGEEQEESQSSVTVKNALKIGDTVYLLPINNNTKFYILDRV